MKENDLDLKERDTYQDIYYLKGRTRLEDGEFASKCQEKDSLMACARLAVNERTKAELCYVKTHSGRLLDPYNEEKLNKNDRFMYRRVSAEVFDIYVRFLQTGARNLYNIVKREIGE